MRWLALAWCLLGAPLAWADNFVFDTVHSRVQFEVSHLGFTMSQGTFRKFGGSLAFEQDDWSQSSVNTHIEVNSLDLGDSKWNARMLEGKYFNAEQHPQISFRSTSVRQIDPQTGEIIGQLSLLGVTREVTLALKFNRRARHKYSLKDTVGFTASTVIKRSDFGMRADIPEVGDEVHIHLEIEANRLERKTQLPRKN